MKVKITVIDHLPPMSSSKEVEMTEQDETSPSNPQQPTNTPKAAPKADLITLAFGCDLDENNNNPLLKKDEQKQRRQISNKYYDDEYF